MTEMMVVRPEEKRLCLLSDLEATGAKSISGKTKEGLILVRSGAEVRCYVSHCPHLGVPLEMMPDHVLDEDREFLVCSAHGARFQVEDGLCVGGPCRDQNLEDIRVVVEDGVIYLQD